MSAALIAGKHLQFFLSESEVVDRLIHTSLSDLFWISKGSVRIAVGYLKQSLHVKEWKI